MKQHILTIDDEAQILELLRHALTAAGYRVTGVSSAAEAMEVVRKDPPQLVLTDLQLEEGDGFDVIEQVKAAAPQIPIILLTGALFDAEVLRGPVGDRIVAYLDKTNSLEKILQEVKRHLPA